MADDKSYFTLLWSGQVEWIVNAGVIFIFAVLLVLFGLLRWKHGRRFLRIRGGIIQRIKIGASDVQANYTRGYTWCANQFGHISLGLLAALLYKWIGDAACLSGPVIFGAKSEIVACAQNGEGQNLDFWGTLVLTHGFLSVCAGVVWWLAIRRILHSRKYRRVLEERNHRLRPHEMEGEGYTASLSVILTVGAIFFLGHPILSAFVEHPSLHLRFAYPFFVTLGVLFMLCAWLSKREVCCLVLGTLAMILAYWCGYGSAYDAMAGPIAPQWRPALCAAITGTVMWWVKEWGNDVPKLHREIDDAFTDRQRAALPPLWPKFEPRDQSEIRRFYREDGEKDARVDCIFYAVGAFLGFAILFVGTLSGPDKAWTTGTELTAYFAMLIVFLIIASKQLQDSMALDKVNAPYASRLAVFRGAVTFPTEDLSGSRRDHPLDWLKIFARRAHDDPALEGYTDLVIAGPRESGRTPLAIALACEAALVHDQVGLEDKEIDQRLARYMTFHTLEKNNVVEVWRDSMMLDAHTARFVVIDDLPDGAKACDIQRVLEQLGELHPYRRTVWVIETDRHNIECAYTKALNFAQMLRSKLKSPSGKARHVDFCLLRDLREAYDVSENPN